MRISDWSSDVCPSDLSGSAKQRDLPMLICASDGNHGLAVAAAAGFAGGTARIFLHGGVPPNRARRIERQGAGIVWIEGTYDDELGRASCRERVCQYE